MSIIANLSIVFDHRTRVYDYPSADLCFGINDRASHDDGS